MKLLNRARAIVIAATMAAALPAVAGISGIGTLLSQASRDGVYRHPGEQELRRAEELFARTLKGEQAARLKEGWGKLNFDLLEVSEGKERFIILQEREGHRRGRGFFLVRPGGLPLMLQMPHSFKDEQTRRIGLDMALEGGSMVAAWNTVPRWYDEGGSRVDADLAHIDSSYFTAFTSAFLQVVPRGTVAQLHGFEAGKRKSRRVADADVIVSSGTKTATAGVRKAAACLGSKSAAKVLVYPTGVRELGGTTNTIGRLMADAGSSRFIHLELSGDFRSGLRKKPSLRAAMNRCLEEALR